MRFMIILKEKVLVNKIQSYLGFAKKSKAIVFGLDNLEKYNKNIYLILYVKQLSENSLNKLNKLVNEKKWKMGVLINQSIDELLYVDNCKVIGITNENLADAILKSNNYDFELVE